MMEIKDRIRRMIGSEEGETFGEEIESRTFLQLEIRRNDFRLGTEGINSIARNIASASA